MANKPKDTKKDKPAKDSGGGGGGKQKRKKWSKGKTRDKLNNLVLFDKATYDKFVKEVPSYKLITPSVVSERLKIRGSLARAGLKELVTKGLIRVISRHHSQEIYTKIQKDEPEGEKAEKAEEAAVKQPKGQKGKKAKAEAAAVEADE